MGKDSIGLDILVYIINSKDNEVAHKICRKKKENYYRCRI